MGARTVTITTRLPTITGDDLRIAPAHASVVLSAKKNVAADKTRCKAKPVGCPPAYPHCLLLIGQLFGLPASTESGNLFVCTLHSDCPSRRMLAAPP